MAIEFNIGDNVRIVKYGHLIWESKTMPGQRSNQKSYYEDDKRAWIDIVPHIVGKEGKVYQKIKTDNGYRYSLSGISGKHSWYYFEQLELIKK